MTLFYDTTLVVFVKKKIIKVYAYNIVHNHIFYNFYFKKYFLIKYEQITKLDFNIRIRVTENKTPKPIIYEKIK